MKHGWLIFLLTISCGEKRKTPDPAATPTPTNTPTDAENEELRNEITSLKSKMEKLSASGPTTTVSDGSDGWLINVRGASNTDGIKLNEPFEVRLDIAGELNEQMRITLHDCAGFRLFGESSSTDEDGNQLGGNTVNGRVGSFLNVWIYRIDGGTAAPTTACKLRARVVEPDTGEYGTTKDKNITIGSATTYLSDATFIRSRASRGGIEILSLTTHGLRVADGYYIRFLISRIETRGADGVVFHQKGFVWLKRLPDNGKVVNDIPCDIGQQDNYNYEHEDDEEGCPVGHLLVPLPAGKYLISAFQESKVDRGYLKYAFLEVEVE